MSDSNNSNNSQPNSKVWLITGNILKRAVAYLTEDNAYNILGTSSGFGRRLVTSALARGDRVVATARSTESLQTISSSCPNDLKENLRTVELDVTEGEQSIKDKVDKAAKIWGRIDILVNNAGLGLDST